MPKASIASAKKLMSRLEKKMLARTKLDLEIVKLEIEFGAFAKDPQIPRRFGGCRGGK